MRLPAGPTRPEKRIGCASGRWWCAGCTGHEAWLDQNRAGWCIGIGQALHEQIGRGPSNCVVTQVHLGQRQAEIVPLRAIGAADHRDIPSRFMSPSGQRDKSAGCNPFGDADKGGRRFFQRHKGCDSSMARGGIGGTIHDQGRIAGEIMPRQGLAIAFPSPSIGARITSDQRDPAMAEIEQMLDRKPHRLSLVAANGIPIRAPCAVSAIDNDLHDWQRPIRIPLRIGRVSFPRWAQDEPVRAALLEKRQGAGLILAVVAERADRQAAAMGAGRFLDRAEKAAAAGSARLDMASASSSPRPLREAGRLLA